MTTELVPSVSVANLVNQREAIIKKMSEAFSLVREAGEIARAAHLGLPDVTLSSGYYRAGRYGDGMRVGASNLGHTTAGPHRSEEPRKEDELLKFLKLGIDQGGWQYLMHESGLRSLMDADARKKWDEAITSGDIPELTEGNIHSTFKMLHDSRGEMFERGVIKAFKDLSWEYKTNLPQKFGKRIVVSYLSGSYGHEKMNRLDDLVRVLSILDGKPEPDHRQGVYALLASAGLASFYPKQGECENDYIRVKVFKNRNGHITFKRLDLIDKMNAIIAKHYPGALPAPK